MTFLREFSSWNTKTITQNLTLIRKIHVPQLTNWVCVMLLTWWPGVQICHHQCWPGASGPPVISPRYPSAHFCCQRRDSPLFTAKKGRISGSNILGICQEEISGGYVRRNFSAQRNFAPSICWWFGDVHKLIYLLLWIRSLNC